METYEKIFTNKYETDNDNFEFSFKRVTGGKEEKLYISIENEENEVWEFISDFTKLIDIDPIFKKFTEIQDVIDLMQENFSDGSLKVEKIGDKYNVYFNLKFIKTQSCPKLTFLKKISSDENPTNALIKSLKKEIEILKSKTKLPVINYVDTLTGENTLTGEINLKASQNVTFHLFIEYRTIYGTNSEEFLYLDIKNDKILDNFKEKPIYKAWHGCYQGGSGYQDNRSVNFIFVEKVSKGINKIILRKKGSSYIYTLHLTAEL